MNILSTKIFKNEHTTLEYITLFTCFAMALGFNYSRALLSLSVVLFFILGLYPKGLKRRLSITMKDWFSILCITYFLAICVSGLWSENLSSWYSSVLNASAFVVMPFSMLVVPLYKAYFVKRLVVGIALIMISGLLWSLSAYVIDWDYFGLWERHIPTAPALGADHIRYSIGLAFAMTTYIYVLRRNAEYGLKTWHKITLYTSIGLTALYINLQIGKIGAIAFYGILLMLLLYLLFTHKSILLKWMIAIGLCVSAVFMVNTNRFEAAWDTFLYEYSVFINNESTSFEKTNSFAPRLISFDVASQLLSKNALVGVGVGDVKNEMIQAYEDDYGTITKKFRLIPHNQYLYSFLALGFPLGSLLVLMLFSGFINRTDSRVKIYVVSISVMTMVICMIEAILIVQMSIYAYLFFLLFFRNIKTIPQLEVLDNKILS